MGTPRADQAFPTAASITYELKFDITNADPDGKVFIGSAQGASDLLSETCPTIDSYTFQFVAVSDTSWIRFEFTATSGTMNVDNVSVKAITALSAEGKGLWQLIKGQGDNHEMAVDFLRSLRYIREPRKTPILDDLEREYGIYPNPALTETVRRQKLAATKYARVGNGSKDQLQNALRNAGFDNLYVWENSPAQDPSIFFGGALMYCTETNPLFVSVSRTGTGDQAMTSPDGLTWTGQTTSPAPNNQWWGVTYGNGLYVAVSSTGTGDRVMTSSNGTTWVSRTSAADNSWRSVTFGAGLYVAVASDGYPNQIMTSPDGSAWTLRTSPVDRAWQSVTYGNGLFVAVARTGTGNRIITSSDGITWTAQTSPADYQWVSVTYGNGLFVAVATDGYPNQVMTSPDGINWTLRTVPTNLLWRAITYGAGVFVATARSGTGNRAMSSTDGITWVSRTSAADNSWWGLAHRKDIFAAVSTDGYPNQVMTSPAGTTWTSRTSPVNNEWIKVTTGNVPESLAQCGEPSAQCGKFEGEVIVNGDVFDFTIDYLALGGETLTQCGEPTAVAGNFSGVTRTKIEYDLPPDPEEWPFVFFVGGQATVNPDTGASIYCGDTLAQCGEPTALGQFFQGEIGAIDFESLPYSRRADLVRLILQIKPVHSWCALLVNFT